MMQPRLNESNRHTGRQRGRGRGKSGNINSLISVFRAHSISGGDRGQCVSGHPPNFRSQSPPTSINYNSLEQDTRRKLPKSKVNNIKFWLLKDFNYRY